MNKCLAAYTGPTPETGYVGYVNLSRNGDNMRITVRPESADGGGTAVLSIPLSEGRKLLEEALAEMSQ